MRLNPATGPGVSIPGRVKVSDRIVHIIVSTHHKFSFSLNILFEPTLRASRTSLTYMNRKSRNGTPQAPIRHFASFLEIGESPNLLFLFFFVETQEERTSSWPLRD